ncbi:ATP-binding protein [Nocardiopsis sp. CNT-189]
MWFCSTHATPAQRGDHKATPDRKCSPTGAVPPPGGGQVRTTQNTSARTAPHGPITPHSAVFRCSLPGKPSKVAEARRWAAATLAHRVRADPAVVETAELLISEAVTNAITHTATGQPGGSFTVVIRPYPAGVRIEVHDAGGAATAPRPLYAADADEHGRGLALMAILAQEWGILSGRRVRGVYFILHEGARR